jgi:hypothetical protein
LSSGLFDGIAMIKMLAGRSTASLRLDPSYIAANARKHRACVEIVAKRDRHGKLLSVCHIESRDDAAGKPLRATIIECWYKAKG